VRYVQDSCIHKGVFVVRLLNDVSQSLPRPTLVAMATNFEPKLAITWLVSDIYLRCLRRFSEPSYWTMLVKFFDKIWERWPKIGN